MLALSVSLSGCDQFFLGGGGGGAGGGGNSTSTSAADDDSNGTDDASDLTAACPAGSWTLVNESWASSLETLFAEGDLAGSDVRVTGSVVFDWDPDGSYLLTNTASQYDISGTTGGSPYAMRVVHNGTESGTWVEGSSGVWTQSGTPVDNVESVVSLGESEATLTPMSQADEPQELFSGTMTVSCTASGMTTSIADDAGTVSVDWVPSRP
jgi:hypothetical protein